MLRKISLLLLLAVFACRSDKQDDNYVLKIRGSESLYATFQALKADFESVQKEIKIELQGGGSRIGMTSVADGSADLGLSSFEFNLDSILGPGHSISAKVVAYDGIMVITHSANRIENLSNEQMNSIYSGKTKNWEDLGGASIPIVPIVRDSNSGTQQFFTDYFRLDTISKEAFVANDNFEIAKKVSEDQQAIGFMGLGYFVDRVNLCGIEKEDDTVFLKPVIKHLENGDYPLKRALMIYYSKPTYALNSFLDYLNTDRAKSIIRSSGLMLPKSS